VRREQLLLEAELSAYRADCEKSKKFLEAKQRKQRLHELNDQATAAAEAAALCERFVCVSVGGGWGGEGGGWGEG